MNVLVACEESQEVCKAFRAKGHRAFSCDIQECSGGHPEWHIRIDVRDILNPVRVDEWGYFGIPPFVAQSGDVHAIDGRWDLLIGHPPCQKLSCAGAVNLGRRDGSACETQEWRERFFQERTDAAIFFMTLLAADVSKIAIENPVGYMSTHFRKPDQYIEPYWFGDPWKKKTGLWLKGLAPLRPTNVVEPLGKWVQQNKKGRPAKSEAWEVVGVRDAKKRSRTFPGIAKAMADQWG